MFGSPWSITDVATFLLLSSGTGWLASRRSPYLLLWSKSPWIFFVSFYVVSIPFTFINLQTAAMFFGYLALASAIQGLRIAWRRSRLSALCILGIVAMYPITILLLTVSDVVHGSVPYYDLIWVLSLVPIWALAAFIADVVATKFTRSRGQGVERDI
ncbi:MAG: hypothetical protein A2W66_00510 [Deltaproteobacteria bacterium RIFCSPLOWO2_02_56_12]|nr:MAG: hypothetical protein A2W66_00510 [Deltaproteobacteria bacterium RIFCSPLOWO2_02_56_12]